MKRPDRPHDTEQGRRADGTSPVAVRPRRRLVAVGALALLAAVVIALWLRPPAPPSPPAQAPPRPPAADHLGAVERAAPWLVPAAPPAERAAAPAAPAAQNPTGTTGTTGSTLAAAYVGAQACGACHKRELAGWQKDWHPRALSRATPAAHVVVGRFSGVHFKGDSSEAWMRTGHGGYLMRTRGSDGALSDYPVDWVVGGKRMQDAVTVLPDGRWQVLPVYYHVTGRGAWVDYNETKQGAVDPSHPFFWTNFRRNVQHECLDCHTTGLRVSFDRTKHKFSTEFADAGVGCESCHGPGGRHADSMDKRDIVQPAKLDRERGLGVCAQCHGPRNPLFPVLDAEHHFRPGDRYGDFFQPLVVVNGSGRSGEFFADGRPKSSSFEYQALIQSRCYLQGGATCLSCHTAPHNDHAADELKRPPGSKKDLAAVADASCKGCHAALAADVAAHSHHRSAAAQSCVACHMPRVVTGVLDTFADHALDVPVPRNSERHGVPSACGVCHKDRTPAQLDAALRERWPQAGKRQARRLRLADAIDETTAAGSRPALLSVLADRGEAPSLRATCAILLAQRFPRGAAGALVPLLAEPDALVRWRAIEALGQAQAREAASAIAAHLRDPELPVRVAAAVTLVSLGDARGEAAVRELGTARDTAALMLPHYALAQLLFRRGELEGAARSLERAIERMPYFVDGLVGLGEIYRRMGRPALARARFSEALFFDPYSRDIRQRLEQLDRNGPPL